MRATALESASANYSRHLPYVVLCRDISRGRNCRHHRVLARGKRPRQPPLDLRLNAVAFVEDRKLFPHDERVQQDIETESVWMGGARNLEGRDIAAMGAGRAELLRGRLFPARIQNEARRTGTGQLLAG